MLRNKIITRNLGKQQVEKGITFYPLLGKRSKILEVRFRRLLRLFALDLTASDAARLTGLNVRAVNAVHLRLRHRPDARCPPNLTGLSNTTEATSARGGCAAGRGKCGLFKRGGQVYTKIVPDCSKKTL